MRTALQHRNSASRGDGAFGDQLAASATEPRDHAVDEWVVGSAVDLRDGDPVLDRGEHADLPVGDMPREDDHATPRGDCLIHVVGAARLDTAPGFEDPDFAQM